jgi:general secretion pathway protein I
VTGTNRFNRAASVRRSARRRGFTLVEVLVTLVLISIVVPVAMRGVSLATNVAGSSSRRAHAAALADSMLNTLIATDQINEGQFSGDFEPEDPDYSWTADVSQWDGPAVLQVDLAVHWEERGMPRSVVLTTLVYLSGQSELVSSF